jgi:hypothetical protein
MCLWKFGCVRGNNLRSGETKSCGCLQKEVAAKLKYKHGLSRTKEYRAEQSRKRRDLEATHDYLWGDKLTETLKKFQPVCVVCGRTEEENRKLL